MSSVSYVGLPRGAQNPFGGQNPFGCQNSFGRSDDEHAGKDVWPPGLYRDGSKTEELKAARAGSSTYSPVFHHANGAGSKTEEPKTAFADMSILHYPLSTDPIGECKYCLTVGKHYTAACPYRECVPKGATVSSCCEILCRNCSGLFTEKCCDLDEGRAILKQCVNCGPCSDHWTPMCPLKDGVDKSSIPISMDLAPEKSKVAPAGHLMASYSPLCHCVTVQFSNDEHGGKDLWPPGPYHNGSKTEELKAARVGSSTYSPVFHHTNGAGSKTEEPKTAFADMSILHYPLSTDPIGECKYCLTVGKHYTAACPYRECVPKGATVSSCCEILCRNCSGLFTEKCCGLDEGRAILKQCVNCGPCSDHWTPMCPLKDGVNKSSIPISMDLAPEKSKVAPAGHFMASYSPLCHCVTIQFSNDEHGGKDLWPPGAQY